MITIPEVHGGLRSSSTMYLRYTVEEKRRPESYLTMSWFLEKMDQWFDLMSSRNVVTALSHFKMEENEMAISFLRDSIHLFRGLKIGPQGSWKQVQTGLVMATTTILEVRSVMHLFFLREHGPSVSMGMTPLLEVQQDLIRACTQNSSCSASEVLRVEQLVHPSPPDLTKTESCVLYHLAGYIVKRVIGFSLCEECRCALVEKASNNANLYINCLPRIFSFFHSSTLGDLLSFNWLCKQSFDALQRCQGKTGPRGSPTIFLKIIQLLDDHPNNLWSPGEHVLEKLLPHCKGNVGFVFTKEDLTEIGTCCWPIRTPGLGPEKTSFFQALGITTKISRGTIEILSDVQLIKPGDKVGASEATLLNMLNISPFSFGLIIQQVCQLLLVRCHRPCDVIALCSEHRLGPEKTPFFQALGITTKISRGTIEILPHVQLIKPGDKVGASEATLLNMLNISPFSFGLIIQQVYDNGSVYSPEVLDITEAALHARFLEVKAYLADPTPFAVVAPEAEKAELVAAVKEAAKDECAKGSDNNNLWLVRPFNLYG
ncbi:hypothetical protein UPYG_G00167360 [Umbra pygmaea]|uniref:Large ribosomal subunit protein uL10 n=1 Tax=Umbra pygmaea TaxID=75934 RepID=A0ABD0X8V8_UMBPY